MDKFLFSSSPPRFLLLLHFIYSPPLRLSCSPAPPACTPLFAPCSRRCCSCCKLSQHRAVQSDQCFSPLKSEEMRGEKAPSPHFVQFIYLIFPCAVVGFICTPLSPAGPPGPHRCLCFPAVLQLTLVPLLCSSSAGSWCAPGAHKLSCCSQHLASMSPDCLLHWERICVGFPTVTLMPWVKIPVRTQEFVQKKKVLQKLLLLWSP